MAQDQYQSVSLRNFSEFIFHTQECLYEYFIQIQGVLKKCDFCKNANNRPWKGSRYTVKSVEFEKFRKIQV